jgi:hypothetical protein
MSPGRWSDGTANSTEGGFPDTGFGCDERSSPLSYEALP